MVKGWGRPAIVFAVLPVAIGIVQPHAAPAPPAHRVIVQAESSSQAAAAVRRAGGRVEQMLPIVDGVAAVVSSTSALRLDPSVRTVTDNAPVSVMGVTGENVSNVKSVFASETKADILWGEGIDGRGVRVAIIDTGVSAVPDLAGRIVPVPDPVDGQGLVACVNFSGESSCEDSYGHGTFIAGLIAGDGTSSGGTYKGVAPAAEIVSVKIAGRDGSADVSKVLAAIQWVVSFSQRLGIRVLNLSLGTNSRISWRIDPLNFAVQRAWASGLAVVVSAGNLGPAAGTISKPADDPYVITVGAVDDRETPAISDDRMPSFSSRGPAFGGTADQVAKPDVVAPGGRVISLRSPGSFVEQHAPGGFPTTAYRRGSGTSMAAGVVSGAAALILQANPSWSPDRLKFAMTATAAGVAERSASAVGAGLVDAHAAARNAPAGLANQSVGGSSSGQGTLDGSRADVLVSRRCGQFEALVDPICDRVHGEMTAQNDRFDRNEYTRGPWTEASWYQSQWAAGVVQPTWAGSSWYGCSSPSPEISSCWYGSSWYGSSWYGSNDSTFYGVSVAGSSWYGAWS